MRPRPGPGRGLQHFVLAAEARKLYRQLLRELKPLDADTAASVRAEARARFDSHANELDLKRLRVLLVEGKESLKQMKEYLSTATPR
mmetsp:Transcript_36050/g.79247  ORF Transcript_36050/g.79247 Transcript_36050/m.79247 type:complete len:87 (+) Transcript_36050:1265-1525(+)|eukprot:346199-Pleurochrysis_carterae.AAC.3